MTCEIPKSKSEFYEPSFVEIKEIINDEYWNSTYVMFSLMETHSPLISTQLELSQFHLKNQIWLQSNFPLLFSATVVFAGKTWKQKSKSYFLYFYTLDFLQLYQFLNFVSDSLKAQDFKQSMMKTLLNIFLVSKFNF